MAKRQYNPAAGGSVDFSLDTPSIPDQIEPTRWRSLQNKTTRTIIRIYGYSAWPDRGPWFGYDRESLKDAPCTHCGRTGMSVTPHHCPGHFALPDSVGKLVPCPINPKGHVCQGVPSMSWHGIGRWLVDHWDEIIQTTITPQETSAAKKGKKHVG